MTDRDLKEQCCSRDHDRDGNCDVHSAPGVRRSTPTSEPGNPLSYPCRICNAKPGEMCGSIVDASKNLEVPHYTRRELAKRTA